MVTDIKKNRCETCMNAWFAEGENEPCSCTKTKPGRLVSVKEQELISQVGCSSWVVYWGGE